MEIRTLHYFLAICNERNITKAAESLHLTQPSLSRQMKELEDELGTSLFNRGHREITLTPAGYFLRERAQRIIELTDNTKQSLKASQMLSGKLHVGAGESPALKNIMELLGRISIENNSVWIDLTDDNADEIEQKVADGTLDFGIVMGDRHLDNFESIILPEQNEFVAVFNKDLPLADKKTIFASDLVDYPIIVTRQTLVKNKFNGWMENYKDKLNFIAVYNLPYNASLMAQATDAVILTYRDLIPTDTKSNDLTMRPLSPKMTDSNVLIWKRNSELSNLANYFIKKLREELKTIKK